MAGASIPETALACLDTGVLAVSPGGALVFCNAAASRIIGLGEEAALGMALDQALRLEAEDGSPAPALLAPRTSALWQELRQLRLWLVRQDGRRLPVELGARLLPDGSSLAMVTLRDLSQQVRQEASLSQAALHDGLTGLASRALLLDRLGAALARRQRRSLALLLLQVENLDLIERTLGQEASRQVLHAVGKRIRAATRPEDTAARYGERLFTLLLEPADAGQAPLQVGARLLDAVQGPLAVGDQTVQVRVSVEACFPEPGQESAEALMRDAQARLLAPEQAKNGSLQTFIEQKRQLQEALATGRMETRYQPIVRLADSGLVGMEASLHWQGPGQGWQALADQMPLALATGLILPLGDLVLDAACQQLAAWRDQGLGAQSLTLAISHRQFEQGLASRIRGLLASHRLPPSSLTLAVPEASLTDEATGKALQALAQQGVGIALDDFGAGPASLASLAQPCLGSLRLAPQIPEQTAKAALAAAQSLGLATVAKDVATAAQAARLRAYACDAIQGAQAAPPLPAADMTAYLAARQ